MASITPHRVSIQTISLSDFLKQKDNNLKENQKATNMIMFSLSIGARSVW
ncbi:hypothetical protein CCYN2B_330014 [Capnocytophaga cynodegmi]|uniref:Uncharacterized protein n=1 Tax=Capnocytophaga cynodegmi TaxID=28189 RepID=A0A0B7HFW2_9FLAO|nr:hypothetical protein CCYN2B_330014 [Capnocytophaga cynodegmi]